MSLSASADEVKTTSFNLNVAPGGNEEIALDAAEDREIIGWQFTWDDVNPGNTYNVTAFAHTGNNPRTVGSNDVNDQEQFFTECNMVKVKDDTNTNASHDSSGDEYVFLPQGESFPWDRHVTLTFIASEAAGDAASSLDVRLYVYYKER